MHEAPTPLFVANNSAAVQATRLAEVLVESRTQTYRNQAALRVLISLSDVLAAATPAGSQAHR